jgi:uncharacterized protein (TIGR00251 family)
MSTPEFARMFQGGVCLAVKVQPRASKNEVAGLTGAELKIRVTAPPVDSAANEAVLSLLAERLNCARGSVRLLRGQASRHKQILIVGMSVEEIVERLALQAME